MSSPYASQTHVAQARRRSITVLVVQRTTLRKGIEVVLRKMTT